MRQMDFERELRVFLEIEQGIAACPDDMVHFTDATTEEEILEFLEHPQAAESQMTSMEWKQKVKRCRDAYLYACFAYYATNDKMRATYSAKEHIKCLIELFASKNLIYSRMERRLGQLREALAAMR